MMFIGAAAGIIMLIIVIQCVVDHNERLLEERLKKKYGWSAASERETDAGIRESETAYRH